MAETNISIMLDEDIKRDAEALFSKLGLTLSSATNIFFRQALRTNGIPFPLTIDEASPALQARKEFGEAFNLAQQQSIANGTSSMTISEIDDIISVGA